MNEIKPGDKVRCINPEGRHPAWDIRNHVPGWYPEMLLTVGGGSDYTGVNIREVTTNQTGFSISRFRKLSAFEIAVLEINNEHERTL